MGKTKSVKTAEASAVPAADAVTADAQAVNDGAAPPQEATATEALARIVILAYEGTGEILLSIWNKMCPAVSKTVITVEPDTSFTEAVTMILADTAIADRFVLVPAVSIPCAPVSFDELHLPVVYVDNKGTRSYDRFPIACDKEEIVRILSGDEFNPETLAETLVKTVGRPVEATFKDGNMITPVMRSNPCEHIVLEALVRKKYIFASAAGLKAIVPLLQNTLLKS